MCVVKRSKWQRLAALLMVLVVAVAMPFQQVHAAGGAAVLIAVAGVAVVTAALVGLGVVKGQDTEAWDKMITDVVDKAGLLLGSPIDTVQMAAAAGTAYLSLDILEAIKAAAVALGIFDAPAGVAPNGWVIATNGDCRICLPRTNYFQASSDSYFRTEGAALKFTINGLTDYTDFVQFPAPVLGLKYKVFTEDLGNYNRVSYQVLDTGSIFAFPLTGVTSNYSYTTNLSTLFPLTSYVAFYYSGGVARFVASSAFLGQSYSMSNVALTAANGWSATLDDDISDLGGWGLTAHLPSISLDRTLDTDFPSWVQDAGVVIDGTTITGDYADGKAGTAAGVISVPVSVPDVYNPAGAGALTQDKAQAGSITDDVVAEGSAEASDAEKDKTLDQLRLPADITGYFPFCIPFDIIRGVQMLQAPGAAPPLTIPLKAPEYGIDWEWEMDWAPWATVIKVARWGQALVFVIALTAASKKLIWG